jgi:hypothetical protein
MVQDAGLGPSGEARPRCSPIRDSRLDDGRALLGPTLGATGARAGLDLRPDLHERLQGFEMQNLGQRGVRYVYRTEPGRRRRSGFPRRAARSAHDGLLRRPRGVACRPAIGSRCLGRGAEPSSGPRTGQRHGDRKLGVPALYHAVPGTYRPLSIRAAVYQGPHGSGTARDPPLGSNLCAPVPSRGRE